MTVTDPTPWPRLPDSLLDCARPPAERADAAANRARILATAHALVVEHGVDALTMTDLAHTAGVGLGTLYRRYPDKGLLCEALSLDNTTALHNEVIDRLTASTDHTDALDWFLDRVVAFTEHNAPLLACASTSRAHRRHGYFSSPLYAWFTAVTRRLLHQANNATISDSDLDWATTALIAPLALDHYRYQRYERGLTPHDISTAVRTLARRLHTTTPPRRGP